MKSTILILLVLFTVTAVILLINRFFALAKPGNARKYNPNCFEKDLDSPLRGKQIFVLGSSVTQGMASHGISFTDYLEQIDGCEITVDAVVSSTIADRSPISYLHRLQDSKALSQSFDLVLIQLSTNDAVFGSRIGEISESCEPDSFDTKTTIGALEMIVSIARKHWDCPLVFFTGSRFDNPRYHQLVNLLIELSEKWNFYVIDLWHDRKMNAISADDYKLYMNDGIHPTKAGYALWWTPKIRAGLIRALQNSRNI